MKKIRVFIMLLFCGLLFLMSLQKNTNVKYEEPNWNEGYCELDGGRLNYVSVGSKYHYKCEICGKEYLFDKIMSRK